MSLLHVNESVNAQKGGLTSRVPPSDSSITRTKPRSIDLDRHSQLWFSNTPSSQTIILDRHSLATVFSYLQTKERIRVSQVSKGWYAITNDPIAWSSDQHVLCYFEHLVPPKPSRKFLAPPPPPRFPSRYRHLIRRLDLNPAGSPYLLGNMKHMIESDQYLRTLPAKRTTIDDDYGNTVHLRVPREVDEFAESAATVLEGYTGLMELNFISSGHTERLMDTFCRAFFKLSPSGRHEDQLQGSVEEANSSATPRPANESAAKARARAFKKVCIQLPRSSSLPIIFQSPLMHQIETLSINLGSTIMEHLRAIRLLRKLQDLTFQTSTKTPSELWPILQQLPELHTLSVEGVDCCTNSPLPPSLTNLTLFLIHADSFTREVFPSLSTATSPLRLTHLTLHLFPLTRVEPIDARRLTHREAFLWRLAEHVTTLHHFNIQYEPDWSDTAHAQETSDPSDGWFWQEFLRVNRSELEVERLTIVRQTMVELILTRGERGRGPAEEDKSCSEPFPPGPPTPIELATDLSLLAGCVCFTFFAPVMTPTLKHLTLSNLIFDHDLLHTLNHLPLTVQLESLTLYPIWPNRHITVELFRLFFRAIGHHPTLTQLKIGGRGMIMDSRLTYEPDISDANDDSGLRSLLSCQSLTSIHWDTPIHFARSAIFRTLGQLADLRTLHLMVFTDDHDHISQLFASSSSSLQHLALSHYLQLRRRIEDAPSSRELVQLLRPYATRVRSITLNELPLAVWEQELMAAKRHRCLIQ